MIFVKKYEANLEDKEGITIMDTQDNNILHKEIDIIQDCIKRMADCSFKLKGWYISLVTLAMTLLIGQGCKLSIVALFLLVVTTVFWGLDGFFLKMETLYRWKYEWVIDARLNGNTESLYDLNPNNKKMWKDADKKNSCIMKFILSKTLFPLYGTVWIIAVGIIIYIVLRY
jgi:hypothetical protein